nr:laminin subunit alpha-1 [Helicoverpa armigera]
MRWSWLWLAVLVAAVTAKGKKHRHNKPGRALLDRLSSTTVGEVLTSGAASGLVPAPLDVAPYSTVTANATCGDAGAEEYCRDTPGKRGVVCDVCEGEGGPARRRHPAAHAHDGDPATWWQSPTLAAGDYQHVELLTVLPDKMELLHVIIKSGPSPRPLAWSLEVSPTEEGDDWRMVRAFGDRDHCRKLWDLRPERRRRKARAAKRINRADKPACSTQFASPRPLENGEMHVGIGEGVLARRVRLSFRATHAGPARQQYYTVRALTIAARCLCHGHATKCHVNAKGAKCECVHGTCGAHCQRCCSGGAWAPQEPCSEGTGECECGERGACSYDDTGAILCVNCTENRAGPLCDKCLFGFYNALPDGPCLPCDCDPQGSDGSCAWDKKHRQATCECLPGYTGARCDACDTAAQFPACQAPAPTAPPCKCDPRGVLDPERVCDDVCECKSNVVGERCDTCAPGHFGLSAELAAGCRPCYCSHITDSCRLADPDELEPPRDVILPLGEAWLISDSEGNATIEPSIDEQGKPFVISYEVEGWENFYWFTRSFSGEQLAAYGGEVRASVYWGIVRGDTGGNPTFGPDVVLVGTDGSMLAYTNTSHETPGQLQISVPLLEGGWRLLGEDQLATRTQLMDVLRDLKGIMLKAHYHFDQDEVRLESAGVRGGSVPRERCACGRAHAGAHCQRCAWTHARLPRPAGSTPNFDCLPCACNDHAGCDTVDGPCGPCQHNTTGPRCERCLPGHYGNPVQGACKPCACPLFEASNNFSPNCALASAHGDEYVCTQCPDGYTGDHCENCDFGYWGSPTTPGGRCVACSCGGSPCHASTGRCLTCPPHSEGARCDLCKEGYWFGGSTSNTSTTNSSVAVSCVSCACGAGALSAACDARTGQCACRAGWAGRACDTCLQGYGGISAGCPACRCGTAALNTTCDAVTGECACAPGAAPPSCDICLDEHYGLNATGCLGCNCSSIGSESNVCDIRTGQCRCKQHVTGRACDTCEEGYWGLKLGGCRRCACGPGASACDPETGACACADGVGGAHCDTCLSGYYGFGPAGCLPCPSCSDGKVCSPHSGRCVCPGGSMGAGCRQCARGYWAVGNTCRPCSCGAGAVSNICDGHTGECKCRAGWAGGTCEQCAPGHYGPKCRPCQCHAPGTRDCDDGLCPCDEWGRCNCKENVVGEKCDACLSGTFGLSAHNPSGCTACFCFGRAAACTQATLSRAALHAAAPLHVTLQRPAQDVITTMDQDSLLAIHTHTPDPTITLPWPPVPVYVELDKRFVGDRVTSYGGSLRFRVEEEGGVELSHDVIKRFPLVRLYTKSIVLEYFETNPGINGSHSVRLHESLWHVRGGGRASRSALMLALRALDKLLIRLTTRAPTRTEHVHALLLNVSLDTAIPGLSRSEPALGVELCDCPRGYSASSCQTPAPGYWLPAPAVHMATVAGTIVISLEGDAQPCMCNGRATECHPDTGECLNCTMGTGGPRCASCAAGHYGSPGAPGGCQACPCPERARNFADACVVHHGKVQCLCKPGYTGPECAACAGGYRRAGAACVSCGCHAAGSHSPHCDAAGRCHCRDFATGMRCDQCRPYRTYMDEDGCRPCDNCTLTLLDSVEALTSELRTKADPTELSRIPKPFAALREFSHNTTTLQSSLNHLKNNLEHSKNLEDRLGQLEDMEHRVFTEANALKSEAKRREKEADYLSLESMSALEEVLKIRRQISEQVEALDEFARGEKHLSAHRALKEAKHLLRQIKDLKLIDYVTGANDVFDAAHLQSTSVQERNYRLQDTYRRLSSLRSALDTWELKAADLQKLAETVWKADDTVTALKDRVKPRLAAVRDIGLRCRLVLEDITTLSASNITDEIRSSLLQAQTLGIKFPTLAAELAVLTLAAEEKEGILYNLTPVYKQKYLEAVEKHVTELGVKAKEYKSLFAGSRAAASLGVSAAQAWSHVATQVKEAAAAADAASKAAAAATSLAQGNVPMAHSAAKGKNTSEDLKKRGAAVLAKADELRSQLEHLRRGADVVSVVLRGLGWQERELSGRPRATVLPTLTAANDQADRVFASTRVLYDEASELRRRVRYHLRRQLTELQRHGDTALGAAQEHVSQIRGNTVRGAETAAALAAAAAARARQHAAASATLAPALLALQHQVERARHAAHTISVSLTSPPLSAAGCARAYAVWAASPAVSRLALALSFDGKMSDGPLLYLSDDTQVCIQHIIERHMKLSVARSKLRLAWQLGAGEAVILHPELLQATHDDADHTTYRVDIERVWNTVHLRVERLGSSSTANSLTSASNSSAASAGSLQPSQLWLGWPGGGTGLPACVHALYTDDRTVGLWNFVQQPKEAQCTGCTQRWYSGRGDEPSMVWFNGAGYVELVRSRARPADRRQFSVAFTFRTRDEDALLFMALDTANNRSVSVTLRECRVVFTVEYGGSRLQITAAGRHCGGRPAHVQAIRVFASNKLEKGSLRVNGEETLGSPAPPVQAPAALPDLARARYWLGGAPPGAPGPAPRPLLGCVGAVTVDRAGYDLMDAPTRFGVEPRCGERTLRSAILKGTGYIELPSPLIRRKASLGISFRTHTPDGLLLYRPPATDNELADDGDKHYFALVMKAGELELVADAGKGEMRLRTNGTRFDDGRLHTVRIIRMHKQLELWVDEEQLGSGSLPGSAFPARPAGMFLGGVRETLQAAVPLTAFKGTLADFIVDAQLIGLQTAVSWSGAALGRADGSHTRPPRAEPRALHQQPDHAGCTKTSSYTVEAGAVKFGDTAHSHAHLRLPRSPARRRDLTLTLQIRTFASDGLLLLAPGSKGKPKQFMALVLRESKLRLVVRNRKRKEIALAANVSDGNWRQVSIRVSRNRVQLSSEGAAVTARTQAAARAHRLYVGGLPAPPALPHLPNWITLVRGFLGCIRHVSVNGRAEDLVRDAQAHHGVGQCFPNVERAAYFGGDAYATWSSSWQLAAGAEELRLQFRTSEPDGVLLAAAGLLLEIKDGAVVLSRSSGGSERSRIAWRAAGGGACDGAWHSVRARLRPALALQLDDNELLRDSPPTALLDAPDAPPPTQLYIAGLPEGVMETTDGGKNFNGCIRDVVIGGQKKDWKEMESLHNVLLDSCPIPQ